MTWTTRLQRRCVGSLLSLLLAITPLAPVWAQGTLPRSVGDAGSDRSVRPRSATARQGPQQAGRQDTARIPRHLPPRVQALPNPAADLRSHVQQVYERARAARTPEQIQQVLDDCQQLQQLGPSDTQADYVRRVTAWLHNRRGEYYSQQATGAANNGDRDASQRLERQAVQEFSASLEQVVSWQALHNRGVSHAMLGQYDQAIADFTAALEKKPDSSGTRYNRAEILFELGRYTQAESDFDSVLRKDPEDLEARIGRAHARFEQGRVGEALSDFDEIVRRAPERAEAYADRADALAQLGRWDEAARDYRLAIQLNNRLGRAYESAAWLMATCPDRRFRNADLALKAAQRAVELDGHDNYQYLDTLAAAQANAGQYTAAVRTLQQALQLAPQHQRAELHKRLALYQAEQPYRQHR